jgi:hypothetical protein
MTRWNNLCRGLAVTDILGTHVPAEEPSAKSLGANSARLNGLHPGLLIFLTFKFCRWRNLGTWRSTFDWETTLTNEQAAVSIRRVVHTEPGACATAINRNEKKAALDQLSEATAKLKRLAAGLAAQFG